MSEDPFDIASTQMQETELKNKIKSYIFSLLTSREYSKYELQQKLLEKSYPIALINNTLSKLEQQNLQSDFRCAAMLLSHGYKSKWGPNKIRFYMQQKGIDSGIINQVIASEEFFRLDAILSSKPKSETIAELKECLTKPVANNLLETAAIITDEQWCEQAKASALKKFGVDFMDTLKNDLKNKAKLQRFLYNRGFEQEHINFVIQFYNSLT
jgi:SOS response regulatory protein OraA/RecX